MDFLFGFLGGFGTIIGMYWLYGTWPFHPPGSRWGYVLMFGALAAILVRGQDLLLNFISWVLCVLISYGFVRLEQAQEARREVERMFDDEDKWRWDR